MSQAPTVEGAFLNAAFGAQAIHAFVDAYERHQKPVPLELLFPAAALAFNGDLRGELSGNQTSNLVAVIGANPRLKVGLSEAAQALTPFVWRSLGMLLVTGRVRLEPGGQLASTVGPENAADSDRCLYSMRLLGTLCGKVGDPTTVFSLLEVQP
jgi:hypothetical protein